MKCYGENVTRNETLFNVEKSCENDNLYFRSFFEINMVKIFLPEGGQLRRIIILIGRNAEYLECIV